MANKLTNERINDQKKITILSVKNYKRNRCLFSAKET